MQTEGARAYLAGGFAISVSMLSRPLVRGLAVLLLVGFVAVAAGAWAVFGSATGAYDDARGVKVPPGASWSQTLDSLTASGIVASPGRVDALAQTTGWNQQVKAGYYEVEAGASPYAILQKLRRGEQTAVRVTIPPGVTIERIAAVAGRHLYAGPDGMLAALRSDSLARSLGATPKTLIGFMLPDTYRYFWLTPPETVVKRVKRDYDRYVESLGTPPQNLTPADVATMASIVEWESAYDDERPRVAGVYLNRLKIGMPLQADPTVQYALLEREGAKRRLLFVDYRIEHPYNTYRFAGLPPGAVTNPSRSALAAVVEPEAHEYLYFVARGDGRHTFSKTLAEHSRAAEEFYRLMRERRAAQAQAK